MNTMLLLLSDTIKWFPFSVKEMLVIPLPFMFPGEFLNCKWVLGEFKLIMLVSTPS